MLDREACADKTGRPLVSELAPESALPLYLSAVKRDNASLRDACTKRLSQIPLEEWPADAMVGMTALQAMDLVCVFRVSLTPS